MHVCRDLVAIAQLDDPELRRLIDERVAALAEFDDVPLEDLVTFIVVEPGDTLDAIDAAVGRSVLEAPGSHELIEEHAGWYEIVFVLSDDGYGVEVFVPKHPDVPPELLDFCAAEAIHDTTSGGTHVHR